MDARTFVDTQIVGHKLDYKRSQAAEARQAAKAQPHATATSRVRMGSWLWSGAMERVRSHALAPRVAALLAASFWGR